MTREDETEPIHDDALDRIRAEAVKRQQDQVTTAAEKVGTRRRPRQRTSAENDPPSVPAMPTADSPPLLAAATQVDVESVSSTQMSQSAQTASNFDSAMPSVEPEYWQPGSRLGGRVSPESAADFSSTTKDRGLMLAAAILVVAILVAVGLYVLGSVLASDDGSPVGIDGTEQSE